MIVVRNSKPIIKTLSVKRNPPGDLPIPEIKSSFGGHLPNPPGVCDKSEKIFEYQGIRWLDLSLCHYCQSIKSCEPRRKYLTHLNEDRVAYFENLKNKGKANENQR